MVRRVLIVGGGAAGIFAALGARETGAEAIVLERNSRLGIKILISGGGRCNITHDGTAAEIEEGFIRREARFLRYALHELPPAKVLSRLHALGMETTTRSNGRVFPLSERADDVLHAFETMLHRTGAEIHTGAVVTGVGVEHGQVRGVRLEGGSERGDAVVVATGGMSHRKVGTNGDGIRWARELGLEVVPVRPALAPIYLRDPPPAHWHGVALRDIRLSVDTGPATQMVRQQRLPASWRGDMLLTHRGISGPAALEISRAAALAKEFGGEAEISVDLVPDVPPMELEAVWASRLAASPRGHVRTFLETLAPNALVPDVMAAAGIAGAGRMADVSRSERDGLLRVVKSWEIGTTGSVPLDRGEVTAGGIALEEIDPLTMASRKIRGLYCAGEALDIAGSVGGYNLQAAFATGYVAGRSAGRVGEAAFAL